MQLLELIDRAAQVTRTEYQLAKQLGIEPRTITDWKAGRRTCSAEDRALLADIAGVDPVIEMLEAIQERWEGKPKGERLRAVFAKRLQNVGNS
jgi:transcriptional regulator with XRE-family HTH domain